MLPVYDFAGRIFSMFKFGRQHTARWIAAIASLSLSATLFAQGKPQIAVIPKGTTHEFWKSVHAGAVKGSQEANVEIIWKGPLKEDDRDAQISVVQDMINRGVKGIVLAPLDDTALRPVVRDAKNANIPVVIFDSDLKSADYASFIATDNFKGGQLAGEQIG
jgi:ribose transport system substrate-binding protein